MADETKKAGAVEGAIEFNPKTPDIYGGGGSAAAQRGGDLLEKLPSETTAEDVGLQINPAFRPPPGKGVDFKEILAGVKLPERRAAGRPPPTPTPPSAPPLGRAAPETPLSQKEKTPAAAAETTSNAEERSPVVSLHTMKDDIQDAVREQQISMVRAASLEADKRAQQTPPPKITAPAEGSPRKSRHIALPITLIALFLALGGAALYAAYFFTAKQAAPVATSTGLIFAEQQSTLPLDTETVAGLKQTLGNMLSSQANGAGSILQVTPSVTGASGQGARKAILEEFLHALGARPPDELIRALGNDFFFGIHATDVPSAIFILPVVSYDHAFAGMLAWEKTINADLQPLYREVPTYLPLVASSTPPERRAFKDDRMRNLDIRMLRDDGGAVVLYYSFTPQHNFLIIASSPYTFPEVLSRLQAQRKL